MTDEPRQSQPHSQQTTLEYEPADRRRSRQPFSLAGWYAGTGSILGAVVQFAMICGSPRLLFFHASDAAPAEGTFTRFDRVCFLIPALTGIALGLWSARISRRHGLAVVGIVLAILSLLLVNRMGFSK